MLYFPQGERCQPAAEPMEKTDTPSNKKPYTKPRVDSHRVFEVSLACIKIPGSPMCSWNVARMKS